MNEITLGRRGFLKASVATSGGLMLSFTLAPLAEAGTGTTADRGILASKLHSDGRHHDALYVDGGPSSTRTTGVVHMQGKEVFRHAVENMASVVGEVLVGRTGAATATDGDGWHGGVT